MSSSWTTPDPRRTVLSPPDFSRPLEEVAEEPAPPLREDVTAGALTVVVSVLLAAPVGLLWAALAPRLRVRVQDGSASLVRPLSDELIAADAYFLGAVAVAGAVAGLVTWWLARAHGPAVVLGLLVGGLVGGYVAMAVGELVGAGAIDRALAAGEQDVVSAALRLRSREALVAWPVASFLAYLGASFVRDS